MDARDFLLRTVGDEGQYCLFALKAGGRPKQKFYASIDALVESAEYLDSAGYDTYYATATFNEENARTVDNAKQMRSFFLDLDCGEEKPFADKTEAFHALRDFCRRLALPRPLLIDSGRGLHVYWNLTAPVSVARWLPVARKLKELCIQHGFGIDPGVTADAARILRMPGTHNHKDSPPREVLALYEGEPPAPVTYDEMLDALGVEQLALVPRRNLPAGMSAMQEQLLGNKSSSFRQIVQKTIDGAGCAQIEHIIANPEEIDEPLWRAGLSIAQHCDDASVAIHKISEGHPQYNPEETEAKARGTKGPYTCAKFDEYRPGVCEECPLWGKIKSPIVLGHTLVEAEADEDGEYKVQEEDAVSHVVKTYTVPKLPHPYVRGAGGGIYKIDVNEDGEREDKLIYHHDFYVVRRVYDEAANGDQVVLRLHLPKDGVREFILPQSDLYSPQDMKKQLASRGIVCRHKAAWDALGEYVMDWINELQHRAVADEAHRQFGWTEGMTSFVIGDREYVPGEVLNNPATPTTESFFKFFRPKGTVEEWKDLVSIYNQPGMEVYQLIVAAGFGSPLMAFSAINGFIIHLDADTGFGKTTAQYAAASVWGCPQELGMEDHDTLYSKMNRLDVFKNIFCMFDEMTNTTPEKLSEVAYTVSSGRQRNRMSSGSNQERYRGAPWATIVTTSGNMSYHSRLDSLKADAKAEKERVFEIHMASFAKAGDKVATDRFQKSIKQDCYGVAGDVFIRYVVDNRDAVAALFDAVQVKLDTATGMDNTNRFKSAGFAAILTGGIVAEQLGLIDYDMKALFKYVVKLVTTAQDLSVHARKTPQEVLTDFVSEHWNDVLRIRSSADARSSEEREEIVIPETSPRSRFVARYETDLNRLYILPRYFRDWCVKQQLNPNTILNSLGETYGVEPNVQIRMGKGTSLDLPPARAIRIDLGDTPLELDT